MTQNSLGRNRKFYSVPSLEHTCLNQNVQSSSTKTHYLNTRCWSIDEWKMTCIIIGMQDTKDVFFSGPKKENAVPFEIIHNSHIIICHLHKCHYLYDICDPSYYYYLIRTQFAADFNRNFYYLTYAMLVLLLLIHHLHFYSNLIVTFSLLQIQMLQKSVSFTENEAGSSRLGGR